MFLFAEGGEPHTPLIVEFINHYVGKPVYNFEIAFTKPVWDTIRSEERRVGKECRL